MRVYDESELLKRDQYKNVDKLAARIRLHEQFSTSSVNIFQWIFDHLLETASKRASILEIGCGRGDLWKHNFKRIPTGWRIKLTDFSPGMLEDCKQHLGEKEMKRFEFGTVDAQAIPYPDAQFNIVIANMMLYHVPNRVDAIQEFRRVLRPRGKLFAMTVGDNHLRELLDMVNQVEPTSSIVSSARFTLQNGRAQLKKSFSNVKVEPFNDGLYVTELQPLVDYIASFTSLTNMHDGRAQTLMAALNGQIHEDGGIRIQKEVGLFIASGTTRR